MIKVRTPNQQILKKHDSSSHLLSMKKVKNKKKEEEIKNSDVIENIILQ